MLLAIQDSNIDGYIRKKANILLVIEFYCKQMCKSELVLLFGVLYVNEMKNAGKHNI